MTKYIGFFLLAFLWSFDSANANTVPDSLQSLISYSKNDSVRTDALLKLSDFFHQIHPEKALKFANRALSIAQNAGMMERTASCFTKIGTIYKDNSEYNKALENYFNALEVSMEQGIEVEIAKSLNDIGVVYDLQQNKEHAIAYYLKSVEISRNLKGFKEIAYGYLNISGVYLSIEETDSSMHYVKKATYVINRSQDKRAIAAVYNKAGIILIKQNNYSDALDYFEKSYVLGNEISDKYSILLSLQCMAECNFYENNFEVALRLYSNAEEIAKELNSWPDLQILYEHISKVYEHMGEFDFSYRYYEKYAHYKDSIQNDKNQKKIAEITTKYETDKKDNQIALLNKEKQLNHLIIEQKNGKVKNQSFLIVGISLGVVVVLILILVLLIQVRLKKKINRRLQKQNTEILQKQEEIQTQRDRITKQRDKIETQRDLATMQKDLIELQTREITDSLKYAFRIQNALLPGDAFLRQLFPMSFVYFNPKDLVSGDFYWAEKKGENSIIAVADCTGHGVPGAFMSMLGISFLNELVSKSQKLIASVLIDELKKLIIRSLHQTGTSGESKDGMDIAICIFNKRERSLQYSGANNSLYIISKESNDSLTDFLKLQSEKKQTKLYELKADKMPAGIHYAQSEKGFTNYKVKLNLNDQIFLFSDGFADQFGGKAGKKYKYNQFKMLLMDIYDYDMSEQKNILEDTFRKWVNPENMKYEQVDDILVMGVKI